MRSRNIKPGLYKDEDLAALPLEARYLFPGLWLLADCMGRLEDRPRMIKAEVYPYDDPIGVGQIHALLQMLHDSGFIVRYEVGERRYIEIKNFVKHQNPHKNERAKGSSIPEPNLSVSVPKKSEHVPNNSVHVPNNSEGVPIKSEPVAMIPDSGFLITERGSLTTAERAAPAIVSEPEWKRDPVFVKFAADYLSTGGAFIDEDFSDAYQWVWKRLDWEQRADRVKALAIHIHGWDSPRYVPKPRKFLDTEWKRPARARDSPKTFSDQVAQQIQDRLERGEKPW